MDAKNATKQNETKEDLTSINRLRGTLKTKVTRMKTFIDSFQPSEDERESRVILQTKVELIAELQKNIKELFRDYASLPEDVDTDQPITILEEMEEDTENSLIKLKLLLSKLNIPDTMTSVPINPNHNTTNIKPAIKYRLPEIPLGSFSGDVLQFQQFKEQFLSIVGDNPQLSETQKLFYLKSALKGSVKILETSQDTYSTLWNTLTTRFEQKRVVLDAHLNSILNYSKVSDTPNQIRLLIDTINGNLRALKLLNYERNELSDALMLNILLNKIHPTSQQEFEKSLKDNNVPTLSCFLQYLEDRTRVLEGLNKMNYVPNRYSNTNKQPFRSPPTSAGKAKSLLINNSKPRKGCVAACHNPISHPLYKCERFLALSVPERIEIVDKNCACKKCLSLSHGSQNCTTKFSCRRCKMISHNTLICRANIHVPQASITSHYPNNISSEKPSTSSAPMRQLEGGSTLISNTNPENPITHHHPLPKDESTSALLCNNQNQRDYTYSRNRQKQYQEQNPTRGNFTNDVTTITTTTNNHPQSVDSILQCVAAPLETAKNKQSTFDTWEINAFSNPRREGLGKNCVQNKKEIQNPCFSTGTLGKNCIEDKKEIQNICFSAENVSKHTYVFLNTAKIFLFDAFNVPRPFYSILDSASTSCYITNHAANILGIPRENYSLSITGLGGNKVLDVKSKINTRLTNQNNDCNWNVDLLITKKITDISPPSYLNCSNLNIPNNIQLADELFSVQKRIDVLLSAQYFFDFLREGKIYLENTNLTLHNSCFGYLLAGSIDLVPPPSTSFYC